MPRLIECELCGVYHDHEVESCLAAMTQQRDWYRDLANHTRQTLVHRDFIYLNQRDKQEQDREVARRLLRENVKPGTPRWTAYIGWYPWLKEATKDPPDPELKEVR